MRYLGPALLEAMHATSIEAASSKNSYDAIVVGAGATGGLAALLLTKAGLKVLVIDAGASRLTLGWAARGFVHRAAARMLRGAGPRILNYILSTYVGRFAMASRQPIQSQCYAWANAPEQFVDDIDCPYTVSPEEPFTWLRSRQLGGRMVIPNHGRQYYRISPEDLDPEDELSPVWPMHYTELVTWYDEVERLLGLSGGVESAPWFPMCNITYPLELTPREEEVRNRIKRKWPNSHTFLGTSAQPMDCLEAAAATGRLSVRSGAIAREIEVDQEGHVRGVVWIDAQNKRELCTSAGLVFLCASALESTRILLLSRTARHPMGIGANSGVLGHYLMDHVRLRGEGLAQLSSNADMQIGRCIYLPRFDARDISGPKTGRGFGVQLYAGPGRKERRTSAWYASGKCFLDPKTESILTGVARMHGASQSLTLAALTANLSATLQSSKL
jgi:choline dehydrogenase-like flavoprotein